MAQWVLNFPDGPMVSQLAAVARRRLVMTAAPVSPAALAAGEQPTTPDPVAMDDPTAILAYLVSVLKTTLIADIQTQAQAAALEQVKTTTDAASAVLDSISIAPAPTVGP